MIYGLGDKTPQLRGKTIFVAESADIIGDVVLEELTSVWFNAVIRGDTDKIYIGAGSNVQDNAVLHTDPGIELRIGKNVTIGHGAMVHGCTIGEGSLIGINAVVLNNAQIGKYCLIGANALVPEGMVVPDHSLVLGSPGKVVRELNDEARAQMHKGALSYQDKTRIFLTELQPLAGR